MVIVMTLADRSLTLESTGANALLERFLGADGNLSLDSVVTLPVTKAPPQEG